MNVVPCDVVAWAGEDAEEPVDMVAGGMSDPLVMERVHGGAAVADVLKAPDIVAAALVAEDLDASEALLVGRAHGRADRMQQSVHGALIVSLVERRAVDSLPNYCQERVVAVLDLVVDFGCVHPIEDPAAPLTHLAVDMLEDGHLVAVVHQLD